MQDGHSQYFCSSQSDSIGKHLNTWAEPSLTYFQESDAEGISEQLMKLDGVTNMLGLDNLEGAQSTCDHFFFISDSH